MSEILDAAEEEERRREGASGKDPRLVRIERLAKELHDEGHDFAIEKGEVYSARPDRDTETTIDLGSDNYRFAVISDTHQGSRYEQLSALRAFYHYALEEGCAFAIHGGDVTQGSDKMHRGMELEVHAHGADAQVAYVVDTFPHGLITYTIGGNHDDSFNKDGGVNVVRKIAALHPDIEYVGQDAAYLDIGPTRHYLIHPAGGGAYAKSYKGQKIAESLEGDVDALWIGHYHNYAAFKVKSAHVVQLPCFQSQYAWLARKALHPDIGGLIVDMWLADDGSIARFRHEVVSFPVIEEDYDREASARAGRGWSVGEAVLPE